MFFRLFKLENTPEERDSILLLLSDRKNKEKKQKARKRKKNSSFVRSSKSPEGMPFSVLKLKSYKTEIGTKEA